MGGEVKLVRDDLKKQKRKDTHTMINRIPHPPIKLKCSGRTIVHTIEANGSQKATALEDSSQPWLGYWMTNEEAREWKGLVTASMTSNKWEVVA
jgi:hypothetical protein